jgi:hypothetical protein
VINLFRSASLIGKTPLFPVPIAPCKVGTGSRGECWFDPNAEQTHDSIEIDPRPLIRAIVDVMAPKPGQVIGDPACGTGGFLLAAHDYISQHNKLSKPEMKHLRTQALRGTDIVPGVVSLCAMNLYLHGIGSTADANDPPVDRADALAQPSPAAGSST